uniref:alpha-1,6-mannosylglycoprotein 6-beta-N-acetylglucosaminyltransferase A-like n=1 Tax=Myxine glutinosa TaxID=7769 RepID=UPI00358EC919
MPVGEATASPSRRLRQRLGVLVVAFGLLWALFLFYLTVRQRAEWEPSSAELREQVLELSRKYVRTMVREGARHDPGSPPFQGSFDLHSTLALLLNDILQRVQDLELTVTGLHNSTRVGASHLGTGIPGKV